MDDKWLRLLSCRHRSFKRHSALVISSWSGHMLTCTDASCSQWLRLLPVHVCLFGFAVTTTSPTLFHRLRIFEQVEFKVAVMVFRVLYGLAPSYIDQLVYVTNLPGHRRLCWSPSQMRQVPAHRFATVGRRSFPVAASILDWIVQCFTSPPTEYRLYGRRFLQVKRPNQQYQSTEGGSCKGKQHKEQRKHKIHIRCIHNLELLNARSPVIGFKGRACTDVFRRRLKTHLLQKSFAGIILWKLYLSDSAIVVFLIT